MKPHVCVCIVTKVDKSIMFPSYGTLWNIRGLFWNIALFSMTYYGTLQTAFIFNDLAPTLH